MIDEGIEGSLPFRDDVIHQPVMLQGRGTGQILRPGQHHNIGVVLPGNTGDLLNLCRKAVNS